MGFKIKGASIREITDYIVFETMTCSEAERVLRGWLELNGWKQQDVVGNEYNIEVPEGREYLVKFCPICGAEFQTITKAR